MQIEKCYNRSMEEKGNATAKKIEDTRGEATGDFIVKPDQTPRKGGFSGFLQRNYPLFFAPLFVIVAYIVQSALYAVYPFGEIYTAASYDLSAQICPFIEHLFDVIDGRSSLFYSYAIAGGADVFGTFAYFFISPFSFLFLIFGDGRVAEASAIVILAKLASIAVTGAWFSSKLFKNIPPFLCTAIGIMYAYCGYTFVSNTYINWMDFLIYGPLATAAFLRFYKTGSFLPFAILLSCAVYTCFSIACFSFFTIFPVLVLFAFCAVEKSDRRVFLARLTLAFAVAVLLSLPILLPSFVAFLNGGRGGSLFENLWMGLDGGIFGDFDRKEFFDNYSVSLYRKWTYIFSDGLFVLLTLLYFIRTKLKTDVSRFMLLAGIFTLLPLLSDESMNLLNMGSYMSYALRFGFLNALYFLGGACLALEEFSYVPNRAFDGTPLKGALLTALPKNERGRYASNNFSDVAPDQDKTRKIVAKSPLKVFWQGAGEFFSDGYRLTFFIVALALATFLSVFVITNQYRDFWGSFLKDSEGKNAERWFSSNFTHSLGGLPTILVFFFAMAILFTFGVLLAKKKRIGVRALSWILIGVTCVQIIFFNEQLVLGNRSTQHVTAGEYSSICRQLSQREEGYFRIKDVNDKLTANAPISGGGNAVSVFSSVIDKDNFIVSNLFGFKGNGKNSLKSAGGGVFANAFMGYKYYLYAADEKDKANSYTYLSPVQIDQTNQINQTNPTDGEGKNNTLHTKSFYVYENEVVFPHAYVLPAGNFRFAAENTPSNRTKNERALYLFLGGEPYESDRAVLTSETRRLAEKLWQKAAKLTVDASGITATVAAKAGEYLFLNFTASKGYTVTVNGKKATLTDNDLKFLCVQLEEGENEVRFVYTSPYVSYSLCGIAAAIVALTALAFVVKKRAIFDRISPVLAWSGVIVALAVTAFFFLFPTAVWLYKLLRALISLF